MMPDSQSRLEAAVMELSTILVCLHAKFYQYFMLTCITVSKSFDFTFSTSQDQIEESEEPDHTMLEEAKSLVAANNI